MTQNNGKVIEIESSEEISERVSLQMIEHLLFKITYWEIPGRDRNIKYIHHYGVGAVAAIILFDTTKVASFERAQSILESIEVCDIPFKVLVGNKVNKFSSI
jgi:signal recognition particle receptor subunit beta